MTDQIGGIKEDSSNDQSNAFFGMEEWQSWQSYLPQDQPDSDV